MDPSSKCKDVKFEEPPLSMETTFEENLIVPGGSSSASASNKAFLCIALTPASPLSIQNFKHTIKTAFNMYTTTITISVNI